MTYLTHIWHTSLLFDVTYSYITEGDLQPHSCHYWGSWAAGWEMSCINPQILCKVSLAGLFNRSLFVFVGLFCKSLFVDLPVLCKVSCVTSPTRRRINTALNQMPIATGDWQCAHKWSVSHMSGTHVPLMCPDLIYKYGVESDANCNWRLVVCTRMKRVTHEWEISCINTALN